MGSNTTRRAACLIAAVVMLLAASAAAAAGATRVRFLQASPAAGSAELLVTSGGVASSAGGPAAFGELTPYAGVPPGPATLSVGAAKAVHTLAPGTAYTVIGYGSHEQLRVLRDGAARGGRARLRIIHAAPDLGTPDIRLGKRVVAQSVHFGEDTGYIDLTPGTYTLAVMAHNRSQPVVERRLALAAGTATTAAVTGSAGAPVAIVTATDDTMTPGGPPETGLGGLAAGGDARWPWVGLAALLGAAAALSVRRLATRRPGG